MVGILQKFTTEGNTTWSFLWRLVGSGGGGGGGLAHKAGLGWEPVGSVGESEQGGSVWMR